MAECSNTTTIEKIKRQITITTIHGDTFTVTDTDDCSPASMTLAEFRNHGIMTFDVDDDTYLVPASAVDSIKVEIITDSE